MEESPQRQRDGSGDPPPRAAPGTMEPSRGGKMLPVWFFVGLIFLIYGILILVTGIQEFRHPPHTVLARELHPAVWWGAILTALGGFYVVHFGPWRSP